jgi:hypothetical protein
MIAVVPSMIRLSSATSRRTPSEPDYFEDLAGDALVDTPPTTAAGPAGPAGPLTGDRDAEPPAVQQQLQCMTTLPRLGGRAYRHPVSPGTTRSADVATGPRGKPGEVRHTHLGGAAMSDLIVIGCPDDETDEKVWDEVVKLHGDFLVDLEDAAIIRRDQKGRLLVTTPARHVLQPGTSAIMVIVRKVTPDKFIEALKPYAAWCSRPRCRTTPSSSS